MDLYQHFRKEEQIFIDQVLDWVNQVDAQYVPYLTPFLNPRQIFIAESIIHQYQNLKHEKYGGFDQAEQKRILIYPPYYEPQKEDFELSLFEVNYPTKFAELSHGQILGGIMGAGFSRSNLGDIFTDGHRWQFIVDQKMARFVKLNLDKVGNISIQLEEKNLDDRIEVLSEWEKEELILASQRLDLVLAKGLKISRNRAKQIINERKVKVNWVQADRPNVELEEYDIVSIRGFGRIKMYKQLGTTRKQNLIVKVGIISRNN